ncbi:MAG: endonuclease/exonuclease/phosphatase family protein [Burkholderiales bacterium]|nr:endonuclease/exonuclease/phosphatase family protein [Burkholderiales bacterium]
MGATFRVLQFNMQFGQSWDDAYPDHAPINLDLTIAEIRAHDADIVLLQEVEQGWPGGAQTEPPPNFMRLRGALSGYEGYFAYPKSDPRELPFGIGLAIFSRTPLTERLRVDVPSPPLEFEFKGRTMTPTDRLLIGATTTVGRRRLRVFNTHLLAFFMLKAGGVEPPGQRELVLARLEASEGPTLLGGDFNVSRHRSLVRQFSRAGFRTVQSRRITWRRRPYVLDHLFYSRHLKPVRHAVKPTPASDHHVLVAEFEFT